MAHNSRVTAIIECGMAVPGGVPLAHVEREISKRERKLEPRR